MGKKRTQGTITSFFQSRSNDSSKNDSDKQPPLKRPRSTEGTPQKKKAEKSGGVGESSPQKNLKAISSEYGEDEGSDSEVIVRRRKLVSKPSSAEQKDDGVSKHNSDEFKTAGINSGNPVEEQAIENGKDVVAKKDDVLGKENCDGKVEKADASDDSVQGSDNEDEDGSSDSDNEDAPKSERNHAPRSKKQRELDVKKAAEGAYELSTKATWAPGKPVPYKFLAEAFSKVESITGRLEIQAILAEVFRIVIDTTPEDLVPIIYLCVNKLAPAHEGVELGIGESILLKALSQVTGRTIPALKSMYKSTGDLGDLTSQTRTTQKTMFPPPPLTVRKVFREFREIANLSGKNTQEGKKSRTVKLLVAASQIEAKYIARALQGKLRIHLADKTVIIALASAMVLRELKSSTTVLLSKTGKKKAKLSAKEEAIETEIREASNILNAVYSQLPVWDDIVPEVLRLQKIDDKLADACKLKPGIPVAPMLAKPTKAIAEVLTRFEQAEFTCEYKYDGERAQVHRLGDGAVKIYSRNAENLTPKYPDVVSQIPLSLKEDVKGASFIIDGEAVAYDMENKIILPFQVLQGRKRKDVEENSITVKVCIFAFDLLYFNGSSLLQDPLSRRRELLLSNFLEKEGVFMFAKGKDLKDPEEIMEMLNASVKEGCEGLMVKGLTGQNSTYEPANRSQNWLKVKKDYLDGCGDTLDLVPIGGYLGRGKRLGTYGAFLLACYDPENEEYQSICKIGTGFSDAVLDELAAFYGDAEAERTSDKPKPYYRTPELKTLLPDKWFEPCQVWEVKCADLSISPQHTAAVGLVDSEKGIALRFPRFLRVRDDKGVEDATSAEQVAELYLKQSSVANNM